MIAKKKLYQKASPLIFLPNAAFKSRLNKASSFNSYLEVPCQLEPRTWYLVLLQQSDHCNLTTSGFGLTCLANDWFQSSSALTLGRLILTDLIAISNSRSLIC